MPKVEWSYLNSIAGTIFGFLRIAMTAFGFLQFFSGVFIVVEELFALELMAYNSDLRLCTKSVEGINRRS
jgi:hypothetical protein